MPQGEPAHRVKVLLQPEPAGKIRTTMEAQKQAPLKIALLRV